MKKYDLTHRKLQQKWNNLYAFWNSVKNNNSKVYQNQRSGTMPNLHKFKMAAIPIYF